MIYCSATKLHSVLADAAVPVAKIIMAIRASRMLTSAGNAMIKTGLFFLFHFSGLVFYVGEGNLYLSISNAVLQWTPLCSPNKTFSLISKERACRYIPAYSIKQGRQTDYFLLCCFVRFYN